ncbi:hypothetical protein J4466_04320 [Candidatus Pacearchaeota archaeon]|nr:hypothetical protein [Candidatus Pacearchaeota archaeon]
MDKDIGKIKKNDNTEIIVRIDDFGGKRGVTIREFTTSDRYTGFTKSGTRIPVDSFLEFRELVNKISLDDLKTSDTEEKAGKESKTSSNEEEEEVEDY